MLFDNYQSAVPDRGLMIDSPSSACASSFGASAALSAILPPPYHHLLASNFTPAHSQEDRGMNLAKHRQGQVTENVLRGVAQYRRSSWRKIGKKMMIGRRKYSG